MVDVQLLGRLGLLAERRRWFVGLSGNESRLTAALVSTERRGLAARPQIMTARTAPVPGDVRRMLANLRRTVPRSAGALPLAAALLAECQAALLDDLAADIAPVWHRVLAVAVDGPVISRRAAGWSVRLPLCDSARLAELCGHNVIDDFAGRDLAQEGRGRPILPLAHWALWHDANKPRMLVQWGRYMRLLWLPAARHDAAAAHVRLATLNAGGDSRSSSRSVELARRAVETGRAPGPADEWLLALPRRYAPPFESALSAQSVHAVHINLPGVTHAASAHRAAAVAVLGQLHVDQVPANLPQLTGARSARVLGRLTPGTLANWHRLVLDLTAARPSVMTLRSAV